MGVKAQSQTEWPGAFAAVDQAYTALRRDAKPLMYYLGVLLVCQLIIIAVTGKLPASGFHLHSRDQDGSGALVGLVGLVLLPYLTRYQLALARGKAVRARTLLKPDFKLYVDLILALLLGGLMMVGGALLLLIPLIWILPAVSLLIFVVVDQDLGPLDALRASFHLSRDNKSRIWSLLGVTILLAIASGIVSLIPIVGVLTSAAVGVVSQAALAILYLWLRANAPTS